MYYHIVEFLEDWENESGKTAKVYSMITEDKKSISVSDQVRSLERLAFHIPQIIAQIGIQTGLLDIPQPPEQPLPGSIAAIVDLYHELHHAMGDAIRGNWSDGMMKEETTFAGKKWIIGDLLSLLIHHEIHHRSQMTVVMRLVGLPVPGLYGPVREDWEKMGLPVPL
jgi:uncharacterized damage-inducible protein DinB